MSTIQKDVRTLVRESLMKKAANYVAKNFNSVPVILDNKMLSEVDCEVYGFDGITVMVKEVGNSVHYYPLFA